MVKRPPRDANKGLSACPESRHFLAHRLERALSWKGVGKPLQKKNVMASRYHLLNCGLIFRIKNGIYFTYTCFCARCPTGFNITRSYGEASFVACNRQVSSGFGQNSRRFPPNLPILEGSQEMWATYKPRSKPPKNHSVKGLPVCLIDTK